MPASKGLYVVKVEQRNAFWSYEFLSDGTSARIKWGRLGTSGQEQVKDYGSGLKRDREIEKKIDEKLRGGYKQETEAGLKKETEMAEALGPQYKIQSLHYIQERLGNSFRTGTDYFPDEGIAVGVLNSWSKEMTWLHLTKKDSCVLNGVVVAGKGISFASTAQCTLTTWVNAIRKFLKDTAQAVAKVVISQFASLGTRKLVIGDHCDENDAEISQVVAELHSQQIGGGGVGDQVLMSFASLGTRVLEL